jgi:hypothetical protein
MLYYLEEAKQHEVVAFEFIVLFVVVLTSEFTDILALTKMVGQV